MNALNENSIVPAPGQVITLQNKIEDHRLLAADTQFSRYAHINNQSMDCEKDVFVFCTKCRTKSVLEYIPLERSFVSCPSCHSLQQVKRMVSEIVSIVEVEHYQETGTITFYVGHLILRTASNGGYFFTKRDYRINLRKDGLYHVYFNGKITRDRFATQNIFSSMNKYFKTNFNYVDFCCSYNPRLKDLITASQTTNPVHFLENWSQLSDKIKRRLYRKYDKLGTKAFSQITPVKELNKILYDQDGSGLHLYPYILESIKGMDVNHLKTMCEGINPSIYTVEQCINNLKLGLSLNYKPKAIFDVLKIQRNLFEDIINLMGTILNHNPDYYVPKHIKKPMDVHDELVRVNNEYVNRDKKDVVLPLPSFTINKSDIFSIVFPTTAFDLLECGSHMNICVGTYTKYVLDGSQQVVFIKKHGKYYGCLSIIKGNLSQAKLKNNRKMLNDVECLDFLNTWLEENNITAIDCYDVTLDNFLEGL